MKKIYITALAFIFTFNLSSELSIQTLNDIDKRVNAMSVSELYERRSDLNEERKSLQKSLQEDDSSNTAEEIETEISIIDAELDAIRTALIAILGLGALSALDDDSSSSDTPVSAPDTIPPVITINGDNPVTIELGTDYVDAGATAIDDTDGPLTVTTGSGAVNTGVVGSYQVVYSATDAAGNSATATRIVNVVDTTAPVITIVGDNPATVELGQTYNDEGATAEDASGSATVTSSGSVDTDTLGSYTITYTATDGSGNSSTDTRIVNVTDTTAPVFTSSSTFVVDEGVTEVGTVTATDLQAVTFSISDTSDLTITESGVLSFISPADYESQSDNPVELPYDGSTYDITATVTATDASSNSAVQIITVSIRDVGGLDDNPDTGTGTNTSTSTGTSTGTGTKKKKKKETKKNSSTKNKEKDEKKRLKQNITKSNKKIDKKK
jgi:hypothetical protein